MCVYLYTGYVMSYLTTQQIVKWADCELSRGIQDEKIIELSLADNTNKVISILNCLCERKKESFKDVGQDYLSMYNIMLRNKCLDCSLIGKEIIKLYSNKFIESPIGINHDFFIRLTDYYSLIEDGFTGNMKMPEELISFLSNYNTYIEIFGKLGFNIKGITIANLNYIDNKT